MKTEASMHQLDIVALLKSLGFTSLKLKKYEDKSSTYAFGDYNPSHLKKTLGDFTLASNGKVAVYSIPKVAKLGVSPLNSLVRFLDQTSDTSPVASDKHLGKVKVTPALSKAFMQAAVDPSLRVAYCKKLFEYFNKEKFHGNLPTPVFLVSDKSLSNIKDARGVYFGGPAFGAGKVWMASFMFNAREPFFLEVFLHELCHAAAWTISRSTDRSERGHGPVWQDWMRRVGLDPRRYDPTDSVEYKTSQEIIQKESQLAVKYGPRSKLAHVEALVPETPFKDGDRVAYVWEGRIFTGAFENKCKVFVGVREDIAPNKYPIHLDFKKKPTQVYKAT
jgi:hypothetical protein